MNRLAFWVFFAILMSILGLRFLFFYHDQPRYADGQKITFETTLLAQPQMFGNNQSFTANYKNSKIKITTGRFPELNYGDSVRIFGPIRVLPRAGGFQPRAREGQPYGASTQNSRVITMYFPKIETVNFSSPLQRSLTEINNIRQKLILLFSKTLPMPASSLLLGIIFGIKEQMPKNFVDNLRTSGVFHVIAASGMNVTLIGGFISTLFAFFLKRQIAIGLSILAIIFYAFLAGLEPSIIRASVMGILVFSAQIIGRQTMAANGLFLAGFAILFIDPALILDVGFQLSFAATAGLVFIPKIRGIGKIWVIGDDVNTTIAAQIATLPILLANFGIYSIYSVLVNGLVLWTVPILMAVGGIGAIIGLMFVPLGQLVIYFCYPLLLYFETIVNFFGKIGGVLTIKNLPWQFAVGYYCLLSSAVLLFKKKS